jgi:hypothetical protein
MAALERPLGPPAGLDGMGKLEQITKLVGLEIADVEEVAA